MAKYEILLILAPGENPEIATDLAKNTFGADSIVSAEKLERTELAYEINKSKTATYLLLLVNAEEKLVAEFVRLTNISKTIWRTLVINLDSEKGLNRKVTVKKFKPRAPFNNNRRPFNRRNDNEHRANRPAPAATSEETKTKE
ncbi:30S ribosomal protein S6 [Candidatus Mycoplasma pogonae]